MSHKIISLTMGLCLFALPFTAQAAPLAPLEFKGIYEFGYGGMAFGRLGIEAEQKPDYYSLTCDISTVGLAKAFVKHTSHTAAHGSGKDFVPEQIDYESNYMTKKKKRYVKLRYKDGKVVEEVVEPAEDPARRPPVPDELKNNSTDVLSLLLALRKKLHGAMEAKETSFSIPAYDGRRLTITEYTMRGKTTIPYNGKQVPVIAVDARRVLKAGYTASELESAKRKEPPLHIFFSDDERLVPLYLEVTLWYGTVSATLLKECRTGESCLLGVK